MKNKFCEVEALHNESDVAQFFVISLLKDLGYKDTNILTKHAIPTYVLGKGGKKHPHVPDYQIRIGKTPVLILEAKNPQEPIDKYVFEAQDYAVVVNRGFIGQNPIGYVLATNAVKTLLAKIDENKPILTLDFKDFAEGISKYHQLKDYVSLNSIRKSTVSK